MSIFSQPRPEHNEPTFDHEKTVVEPAGDSLPKEGADAASLEALPTRGQPSADTPRGSYEFESADELAEKLSARWPDASFENTFVLRAAESLGDKVLKPSGIHFSLSRLAESVAKSIGDSSAEEARRNSTRDARAHGDSIEQAARKTLDSVMPEVIAVVCERDPEIVDQVRALFVESQSR